jgi:hypothetical protein
MTSPHDTPFIFVHGTLDGGQPAFVGANYTWDPPDSLVTEEPQDQDYDKGDGPPSTGPVAGNIVAGGPGPFSRSKS